MPRSNNTWASKRRLEFIDDTLATLGYINRQMLIDQFAVEKSLASMDISAYRELGGRVHKQTGALVDGRVEPVVRTDGVVRAGRKPGSQSFYVRDDDWRSVLDSSEVRQRAWGLLHKGGSNHADWMAAVMTAWRHDHLVRDADDAVAYFGVGRNEAARLADLSGSPDYSRAWIWEVWDADD